MNTYVVEIRSRDTNEAICEQLVEARDEADARRQAMSQRSHRYLTTGHVYREE